MKEEAHSYSGTEFRIVYREKHTQTYGDFQRLWILFKTPLGTWSSDLNVATELIDKEPLWRDYVCSQSLSAYKSKHGSL